MATEHDNPQPLVEPGETPAIPGDTSNPEAPVEPNPRPQVDPPADPPHDGAHDGVQDPSGDPSGGDGDDPAPEVAKLRTEAAKYRKRAQDAETERDQLRDELDGLRRAEIEHRVADRLETPGDLWLVHDTDTFMGDDGIDPTLIDSAVDALLAQRPGWRKRTAPPTRRPKPLDSGDPHPEGTWTDALTNRR